MQFYNSRCNGAPMQEWVTKYVTDGITWFCKQCKTCKSIHDSSFF